MVTDFITVTAAVCGIISVIVALAIYFKVSKSRSDNSEILQVLRQEILKSQRDASKESSEYTGRMINTVFERQDKRFESLTLALSDSMTKVDKRLQDFSVHNEQKLENIRMAVTTHLKALQDDNNKQLEKMRETVDEKLQKTLEDKIGQSFKLVSERLEQVYKGLGEMQTLASGVGDLKKVLSNVKTRGILGEIQLGAILEQMMSPDQYDTEVATKPGSRDRVEFAIKMPGDDGSVVYLPIDAKFPLDAYSELVDAYDAADTAAIEAAGKALDRRIKDSAKDINDKYTSPPETTDFAIMFLPIEGLYAEVVRRGLVEVLQRDYKVSIAGPTTMAALINSLQMGFKTLAIQKRSGEVWKVLGAVKTEFDTFGGVLEQAQKRIVQANDELDVLIGTRTRQIQRKLKDVSTLPAGDAKETLAIGQGE